MGSTDNFLRLLNESNARIAARIADEEVEGKVGVDEVQLQRDQERREKWGQLRAREHRSRRPVGVRSVFGHTRLD